MRATLSATDGTVGSTASDNARLSLDGTFVVFNSRATNLVVGAGGANDILLRDLRAF